MTENSNDNGELRVGFNHAEPDAHGHAALLLVESLLHGLIEQSVFSVDKAVELIDIAVEVKSDIGAEVGDTPQTLQRSLTLLGEISTSLRSGNPS